MSPVMNIAGSACFRADSSTSCSAPGVKNESRATHVVFGLWSMKNMKTSGSKKFFVQAIEFRVLNIHLLDLESGLFITLAVRYPQV